MRDAADRRPEPSITDVRMTPGDWMVLLAGGLVVGLVLAWGLPWLTNLAGSLEWFPFQDPLRLVGRLSTEHPMVSVARWVVLPLAGVVGGGLIGTKATTIRVADGEIVVRDGGQRSRVARSQVDRILLEGKELSIRDDRDVDLVTAKLDVPRAAAVAALEGHGWSVEQM